MKVLDAKGAELHVGDRVENAGLTGVVLGFDCVEGQRYVDVDWGEQACPTCGGDAQITESFAFSLALPFTCSDLLLCTEGSE